MDPQQRRTETGPRPPVGEPGGDVTSIFIAFGVFIAIAALVYQNASLSLLNRSSSVGMSEFRIL